jgi:hypothetical protein
MKKQIKQLKKNDTISWNGKEMTIRNLLPGMGVSDIVIVFTDNTSICLDENNKIIFVEKDLD